MKKTGGKRTGEYIPCPLDDCDEDHEILISVANGEPYINCGKWKLSIMLMRTSTAEKYLGAHKRKEETPEEKFERELNE